MSKGQRVTSVELAGLTMEALARHGLSRTPENYQVIYTHLAGDHPDLGRAMELVHGAPGGLDDLACAELHDRFFGPDGEERALQRVNLRLQELGEQLLQQVGGLSAGTARFNASLANARDGMASLAGVDTVQLILRDIMGETGRMLRHAQRLETRLQESCAEIRDLRQDLRAAWRDARTDALTGLANRRQFDMELRIAAAQAAENGRPSCLLLADIDHFKGFNDRHGHALGDSVLKLVAHILRSNVKGRDLVARYGGEEFAVMLPATHLPDAESLARRLREIVASREVKVKQNGASLGRVTLSIGVTDLKPGDRPASALGRADAALYAAKSAGRDRVVVVPASAPA